MEAQAILSISNVFEYEIGCFALECDNGKNYVNIAINKSDKLMAFEIYNNDKMVKLPYSTIKSLVTYLKEYATEHRQEEKTKTSFNPDMMDLAKELKLERIA